MATDGICKAAVPELGWTGLGVTAAGQLTMTRTVAGRILSALEMHQGERARPWADVPARQHQPRDVQRVLTMNKQEPRPGR